MEQILTTKLFIPPTRPDLVPRPHLIERLNEGLQRKLTLISAPAGFGKTTLVSEWVDHLRQDPDKESHIQNRIAWLSLDESDNDPAHFLAYFIAAMRTIEAGIAKGALSALKSPQPPPTEDILISLINEIAAVPSKIIIVLDDYHLIEAQPIHEALTFLLEHLPPHLHLAIATRDDPLLSLARLRARGQLTELRATDLRFSSSEAAEFLNRAMGLDLSVEDIAALETRTEGWVAGLQLAAISMQGREDATSLIKTFTGSHRFVLDYLIEEVLGKQSESVQNFLLQTAILNKMTGSLCDAITGRKNGQATLETLEHANLFIIPLDEKRRWYRYHHLFVDLLRQRMRQTHAEHLIELHRKASEWYKQNGAIDEAIEHALQAKDFEEAARLIVNLFDSLWQRGEHGKLRRWLEVLPDEFLISEPQLGSIHAYYLHTIGQYEIGEHLLQKVENVLASHSDNEADGTLLERIRLSETERSKLQGRISTIRALIYSFSGDVRGMIQHANQALEYLPEQDLTWRSLAAFALGDAHSFLGDMAASYQARSEALRSCEAAGDIYYIIIANLKLAATLREQGELQQTMDVCRQQIELAKEYGLSETNMVGCLMALWGEVLAELNDLDDAIHQAMKGVEIAERGANIMILGYSYLYLMRVLFSRGDLASAEEIIKKVTRFEQETTVPPWLPSQMAIWQARIWLARDELGAASNWEKERGLHTSEEADVLQGIDFHSLFAYVMLARIKIAQGQLDEANGLLQRLVKAAQGGGRIASVIEIMMLQALAFQSSGDTKRAMKSLEQALNLAEPRGFIRIFVDEGPPMAHLLYEALSRGIAPDYVSRLLGVFPSDEPEQADSTKFKADQSEFVEPLSERELEVLQLVAEGLTNREIASRLYLSLNTVKVHTRNIYGKLNVHSRTQAIARSQALGFLTHKPV